MKQRLKWTFDISHPSIEIFSALTEPYRLEQWFCEHADVSMTDGKYDFWGKYTPGNPSKSEGHHRILSYSENKRLSYNADYAGSPLEITLALNGLDAGTILTTTIIGDLTVKSGYAWPGDICLISVENLIQWLEKGVVENRIDFSETHSREFSLSMNINKPAKDVFDALVNPEKLNRYMGKNAVVERRPGGKYS